MMKTMNIQIYMMLMFSIFSLLIISFPSHNSIIHPLMLCMILMLFTITLSMTMSLFNYSHWFSFIMFLIMVGGMMIIFLYFTSFISNMKMQINWNSLMILPIKLIMMMMFMLIILINFNKMIIWLMNLLELNKFIIKNYNNFIMYMYMYNKNLSTIISMIYLLICLTMIVKITINKKLTLRKMN